jgi:hypothetical protein
MDSLTVAFIVTFAALLLIGLVAGIASLLEALSR